MPEEALPPRSGGKALQTLMDAIAPTVTVAPHVLTRIVADVGFDPSAVVAVAARLSPRQLAGVRHLPADLPGLTADPDVALRVRGLGDRARATAGLAALAVVDRVGVLLDAAGLSPEDWVESPVAGLLTFRAGRFYFRDPRVRAVLRERMPSDEALVGHAILADTCESLGSTDAALWHRVLASTREEPEQVRALDALAHRLLNSGHAAQAYEVAVVAADHAPPGEDFAAATAAEAALHAGFLDTARSWALRSGMRRRPMTLNDATERVVEPRWPRDIHLAQDPNAPAAHWVWPRDDHPRPTPLEYAEAVIAHCLSLSGAGDLGEAHRILLSAAYRLPIAIASHGLGTALARRLDIAVTGRTGATVQALDATSPHRNSSRLRSSALVDEAVRSALTGNLERAQVLLAIGRQRGSQSPALPIRGFDDVEAWLLSEARTGSSAPLSLTQRTGRAGDDPRAAWARIALRQHPSPAEIRSAEEALTLIASPYERAHAELCAAAACEHLGDWTATRAHLIAASAQFAEAGTPAFRDLAERLLHKRPAGDMDSAVSGATPSIEPERLHHLAALEHLTKREAQVAEVLGTGASNRDIARALGLSTRTVEVHVSRIYRKLGVRSRVEFLLRSRRPPV